MAENKKDSFTFSDKIKNSKPAFNPFSKRVSSKIGNNGKPKKTIFERTRRDAPFFIAAAVALLMLPFLYKYSGSVAEEPFVTPGTEDSIFDPERFGFTPATEDPNGQIAQLTGKDSLSLIKGWGDSAAASSDGNLEDDYGRDGFGDYSSPSQDIPRNNYRQSAPAQTRASFKRQTTPIKELGGASLNLRGGGGAYGRFGGSNLKSAAKQDSSGGPRQGVKPVSLQPLRAAGNPSRSYFGQGNAAAARASRDAMGKANAQQALNDAMFRPVGPGHAGGNPMTGDFAPGGGAGKWDNKMDYKGITPWWWDMMKDREQKKWEWKYFLWRKNLVEPLIKGLAEVAVTLGKGLACCLITGADDCGMGNMWGTGEEGEAAGCKINKTVYHSLDELKEAYPNLNVAGDLKKWCETIAGHKESDLGAVSWEAGKPGGNMNFFQVRGNCMGATVKGSIKGITELKERHDCQEIDNAEHLFVLEGSGDAVKWKHYHAVVAKNTKIDGKQLCGSSNSIWNKRVGFASGKKRGTGSNATSVGYGSPQENPNDYDATYRGEFDPENVSTSCVIYVAQGNVFNYDSFRKATLAWMGEEAFKQLHMYFIEGYAMKDSFAKGSAEPETVSSTTTVSSVGATLPLKDLTTKRAKVKGMPVEELPIMYEDFENLYILNKGNSSKIGRTYKYSPRIYTGTSPKDGVDGVTRTMLNADGQPNAARKYCKFASFSIKAQPISYLTSIYGTLSYNPLAYPNAQGIDVKVSFTVDGQAFDNGTEYATQQLSSNGNGVANYKVNGIPADKLGELIAASQQDSRPTIIAHWTARDQRGNISKDDADYIGDGTVSPETTVTVVNIPVVTTIPGNNTDRTALARRITDIPKVFTERNPLAVANQSGGATNIASRGTLFSVLAEADDDHRFSSAFVGTEAASEYVKGIVGRYNNYIEEQSQGSQTVKMTYITHSYPTVPEFVDALNIAKGLGDSEVPKNLVCDMARGIAVRSIDDTPNNRIKRDPNVDRTGHTSNNTFGAFAIYIGDGYLYPAENTTVNGNVVLDYRFDCVKGGKYICNPDYHWRNYVNPSTKQPYLSTQTDIAQATTENDFNGTYPLAALRQVSSYSGNAGDRRRQYVEAYDKVFGNGTACQLGEGKMKIGDAIEYVRLVAEKNGTSFKPKASDKKRGDSVGGTNNTGSGGNNTTATSPGNV